METVSSRGYFAPIDLEDTLREELGRGGEQFGRLLLKSGNAHSYWAQNIWLEPQRLPFTSIKDAAKQLRDIQRNWALYPWTLHRRAKLIQEQLPHVSAKPLEFLQKPPVAQLGAWMLIEPNVLLCSARTSSPLPERRGPVRRREEGAAEPSLSEALGGVRASRKASEAG
jgi:23S rRNA (cytidine2498-2'-O)-methyltransferase